MRRSSIAIALLLLFCSARAQFRGLVINEFSQGDAGSREYIELLVVGHRTCSDSTADIRGWIVDDQNGWYGGTNISSGHYRFANAPQWAAVPFGSIILLYNAASGQKNTSITLADDSTDANKDYTYVLPINTKTLVEEHDNLPDAASPSASFVYPAAASTAGYAGASNLWVTHIALNNTGGDVLSVVSRAKRDSAFFSIGYGFTIAAGYRQPTVSVANVGTATNAWLTDSSYKLANRWTLSMLPTTNETPGLPNGGVNTTWITGLRTTPKALRNYVTACSNGPYTFFGQTFTATGAYTVLHNNASGCVDTNDLYVVIKKTDTRDTIACDSLWYKGIKYTSNTVITDNIQSVVIMCDSIVRTLRIFIRKSSSSLTRVCIGFTPSFTFNGQTFTASGQYAVRLTNAQGCDSIARLWLVQTRLDSATVSGCGSVTYNGQTYTASTVRYDTVRSAPSLACDSVIRRTSIVVNQPKTTYLTACGVEGVPFNYNNTALTQTGNYSFTFAVPGGCDSTVTLYLLLRKTVSNTVGGCDSVLFRGKWYYNDAVVADTVRSLVSNCDSLITQNNLRVNRSRTTQLNACAPVGGSYVFFGQTLTASGTYTQVLQTVEGCDSTIRLRFVVAQRQSLTHPGCDSVRVNGQTFFASAVLVDTLRSQSGCDSLIRTDSVLVYRTVRSFRTACLAPGQTLNFNGQTLSTSGQYTATFSGQRCDSIVQLTLVVAQRQNLVFSACKSFVYNGATYTSSATVLDTVKSVVTGCDSLLRTVQISIQPLPPRFVSVCVAQGGSYAFNGQTLTATGRYTATFTTANGCDSVVNLYLLVSKTESQALEGCGSVLYKGIAYTASAVIADTVRSAVSQCDSLIRTVTIVVNARPLLTVSRDTTICLGNTATLSASSPSAVVQWTGFAAGNSIRVSPQGNSQYNVTTTDANGCTAGAMVKVWVEDFRLEVLADAASLVAGKAVSLQTVSVLPYAVTAWQPASLFPNQSAKSQRIYPDSSVAITVIAKTPSGCADTASLLLTVVPLDDVYIPSGFTPNGDGRNDEIRVMGSGIKELTFSVFNRWGQRVFYSTDRDKGWDGTAQGKSQPGGVYVYVVKVKKANGQVVEKKGTVTLIR